MIGYTPILPGGKTMAIRPNDGVERLEIPEIRKGGRAATGAISADGATGVV